jgi:HSP20 family protein
MVNQFPFTRDFVLLRDAVNQLLEDSFVPSGGARYRPSATAWSLPLDVYATPDEVIMHAAIPGMRPEDLSITYNQNTVTLSGSVPPAVTGEQAEEVTWYLRELWHGQFQRSVTLPFEIDAAQAEATFENGIVRIVLPKAEWTKPQKITVRVSDQPTQAIGAGSQTESGA